MAVVAVLLIHMDRNDETIMNPIINLRERVGILDQHFQLIIAANRVLTEFQTLTSFKPEIIFSFLASVWICRSMISIYMSLRVLKAQVLKFSAISEKASQNFRAFSSIF